MDNNTFNPALGISNFFPDDVASENFLLFLKAYYEWLQTTKISFSSITGTFVRDEIVIGSTSKSTGVISWRTLVFAGLFSSIINSFFSTLFLEGRFPIEDTFDVLTRFIIGDVMGLVLVLLILVGLLKTSRRFVRV